MPQGAGVQHGSVRVRITYSDSIKVSVTEMVKEKINKSTVVVSKVLKPIKILTVIESRQLLLKICTVLDTCTCGYGYKYTLDAILYCESGNFHCKNFIVDGGYKKINLTKISAHYRSLGLAASVSFP